MALKKLKHGMKLATEKQKEFLRENDIDFNEKTITIKQASKLISAQVDQWKYERMYDENGDPHIDEDYMDIHWSDLF